MIVRELSLCNVGCNEDSSCSLKSLVMTAMNSSNILISFGGDHSDHFSVSPQQLHTFPDDSYSKLAKKETYPISPDGLTKEQIMTWFVNAPRRTTPGSPRAAEQIRLA